MTEEGLKQARAKEAVRRTARKHGGVFEHEMDIALAMQEVIDENWRPIVVDPDDHLIDRVMLSNISIAHGERVALRDMIKDAVSTTRRELLLTTNRPNVEELAQIVVDTWQKSSGMLRNAPTDIARAVLSRLGLNEVKL